ncbi:glutaminase kidney isoform, mitochondrial-like [Polyodon spathula]|uniref:glutaminase kidney isoform, mitochondrial-like n=1 Tax=Polyodon spathula TaxID=7913 RepID=UPI001B7DD55B|nr:glutaminase kidney isoform, mitochondrial-like [Polyodon spathula]
MHFLKSLRVTNAGVWDWVLKDAVKRTEPACHLLSRRKAPRILYTSSASLHRSYNEPSLKDSEHAHPQLRASKKSLFPELEDLLFYTITDGQEQISLPKFITAVKRTGLLTSDPRLRDCMDLIRQSVQESVGGVMMDRYLFRKCVGSNIVLLTQAFRKKFVIPDFQTFSNHINQLYDSARKQNAGKVADYIPQLAKFSPDLWGVSLCTVDGQRHSVGDTRLPFCLQSCVKPLEYAIAIHESGTEHVHHYVGKEPSGLKFNKLFLNDEDRPHNPMVNAGAIVISSLIKVRLEWRLLHSLSNFPILDSMPQVSCCLQIAFS